MGVRYGRNVRAEMADPEARRRLQQEGWDLLRLRLGPGSVVEVLGADPKDLPEKLAERAAALAQEVEAEGFDVVVGLVDSQEDLTRFNWRQYSRELIGRLPRRTFLFDAETVDGRLGAPAGALDFLTDLLPAFRAVLDAKGEAVGPGPVNGGGEELRKLLTAVTFHRPSVQVLNDRPPQEVRAWLDDAEELLRAYRYREGWIGSVLASGAPIRFGERLRALAGLWDPEAERARRLEALEREIEARPFWTTLFLD